MPNSDCLIKARWVIPIASPPIQGGWIRVVGQRVVELGSVKGSPGLNENVIDLGDAALLPGLVNSHTHLEFSDCRRPIGRSGMPLASWIGEVIKTRSATSDEDKQRKILAGLTEAYRSGTALVADIATPPCSYPTKEDLPTVVSFPEVLGLSEPRAEERLAAAENHIQKCSAGISPHAPYSTPWSLIQRCVDLARHRDVPLAMHVAESPDERELISRGVGRFADSLRAIGVWRDGMFPWKNGSDFVPLIEMLSKAPSALVVHGNDLNEREIECLSRLKNVTVVYCPRTHDFFQHAKHPIDQLIRAGVRVALGTDSRASNPDLNLWSEVQFLLNHRQDISPQQVLASATQAGATALRRQDFGVIAPNSVAKFAVLDTAAYTIGEFYEHCAERPLTVKP